MKETTAPDNHHGVNHQQKLVFELGNNHERDQAHGQIFVLVEVMERNPGSQKLASMRMHRGNIDHLQAKANCETALLSKEMIIFEELPADVEKLNRVLNCSAQTLPNIIK